LPAATTCGIADFQQQFLNKVNAARANTRMCGTTLYNAAPPLVWNSKLFSAAAGHSTDMAVQNYFSHTSLDGRTVGQRITNAGYIWSTYGENIAVGQPTIDSVMSAWLTSEGHCANIMQPRVVDLAVACVKNAAGRNYWTMDLARQR
jgi:uncharacterized protein YkwD